MKTVHVAPFTATALAGLGLVLGLAVACGDVTQASSLVSCQELAACCNSLAPASQSECLDVATSGVGSTCSSELALYTSSGGCTSGGSGTACAALASCCAGMTGASLEDCLSAANGGDETICDADLALFEEDGACNGKNEESSEESGDDSSIESFGDDSATETIGDDSSTETIGDDSSTESFGDDSSTESSSEESSSESSSGGGEPPPPSGVPTTSSTTRTFAVHHLYLGDTTPTPSYTTSSTAWQGIGFDLDGQATTSSCATCCTTTGTGTTAHQNGDDGIDNSWGENIVAQLSAVSGNLSQSVSEDVIAGDFTLEIQTTGLATPGQTNTGLGGHFAVGGSYGGAPPLTGDYFSLTDSWPVAGNPQATFMSSYVTGGVWVSGQPATIVVPLEFVGATVILTIHHATVAFAYAVNGAQGLAGSGVISGVLAEDELLAAWAAAIGNIQGGSLCSDYSLFAGIMEDAQDLVLDSSTGAVSNPAGTSCNAVSIGLAFDADEIAASASTAAALTSGSAPSCPTGSGSGSGG